MAPPVYANLEDEDLVRLCQQVGAKDDRPFSELFRRHHQHVWYTCYRFFTNPEDTADLTQETFFKAYRGLGKFQGQAAFKTWLHRIALNVCLNELRTRRRRPPLSHYAIDELSETLKGDDMRDGHVEHLYSLKIMGDLLGDINSQDHKALYLREVEHYSFADIAESLGLSLSAAKMRVYRTRLALQKAFADAQKEEDIT